MVKNRLTGSRGCAGCSVVCSAPQAVQLVRFGEPKESLRLTRMVDVGKQPDQLRYRVYP